MATVSGDNYTIWAAKGPPDSFLKAGQWNGKVRVFTDVYEAASIAAATIINVARIPKDAVWLGMSSLVTDALGSGVTIQCGITGATTKFLAATACNTANLQTFMHAIDGLHYVFTAEAAVILTTAGAAATGTIKTEICVAVD